MSPFAEQATAALCLAKGPLRQHGDALAALMVEKVELTPDEADEMLATTALVLGMLAGLLLDQDRAQAREFGDGQ
jgi:hypothetical protein